MGRWWFTSGFWGNFTSSLDHAFVPFSCSPCRESQVCKVVDLSKTDDDDAGAFKEATLLASLHHPYIVRYRDSFCTDAWQHLRKKTAPDGIIFVSKLNLQKSHLVMELTGPLRGIQCPHIQRSFCICRAIHLSTLCHEFAVFAAWP